jgi:hypothetical protein
MIIEGDIDFSALRALRPIGVADGAAEAFDGFEDAEVRDVEAAFEPYPPLVWCVFIVGVLGGEEVGEGRVGVARGGRAAASTRW